MLEKMHAWKLWRPTSPLGRRTSKNDEQYGYNVRDELISADNVSYAYDDIGNRTTDEGKTYTANNLNQYTAIDDFAPQYDADGNQTLIKTETGIWSVTYNAENRPIRWQSGDTLITMAFDRMGRRVEMRTVKDGEETLQRFVYDNYLCIQQLRGSDNALFHSYVWDPTEPIATRPLIFLPAASSLAYYFHDGNKNVSDLVDTQGNIVHYDYTPFGTPIASAPTKNPYRFSSEVYDDKLDLVYYNYRHYNANDGRWGRRDPFVLTEKVRLLFCNNQPLGYVDFWGLAGGTTHGTKSCDGNDNCEALTSKTEQWIAHYEERWRELRADKHNYKETNPRKYNNHIGKIGEAETNILKCFALLEEKCPCDLKDIPTFVPIPLPPLIEERCKPESEFARALGAVNWRAVGMTVACGAGAAICALCPFDGSIGETVLGSFAAAAACQVIEHPKEE